MKRYGDLWKQLICFENVYVAFRKAVKGKSCKPYVLFLVKDLEHNLLNIQDALFKKSYRPGRYKAFMIYEPKKRMISAAPFIDRIVHHCLINVLEPIFEATFIEQSYANRVGKGTHRAIRDVQNAMRLHRYVLHCDLRNYFPSIDHEILKALLRRKIKDPYVLWLIDLIIDGSNPQLTVNTYFPGDHLFTPFERRKGLLTIGTLATRFFANVFLNGLDHFVKEKLGCRFYARYVDDIVVVHSKKRYLWKIHQEMARYLEKLRLRLHPQKSHIRSVETGFRFLGQFVYPDRRLLPKSNIRRFMRRMKNFQSMYASGEVSLNEINQSLQSWLGHARQAHTRTLRQNLLNKLKFISGMST